jgi:enoyl-CoA hydratase
VEFQTLLLEHEDRVAILTLNRPEMLNAMDSMMFLELKQAIDMIAADDEVRVLLIAAAGRAFSSGLDVMEFQKFLHLNTFGMKRMIALLQGFYSDLEALEKPVLAAIHNMCYGGAMELILACDIRFAAEDAVFGLLEVRFNIIPDLGGCKKLAQLVGPGRAKEIIFTCDNVPAAEAYRIGLVEHLTPVDRVKEEALALAKRLAEGPPLALGLAKKVVNRSLDSTVENAYEFDQLAQTICVTSEDFQEAVNAFMQQRKPDFKGR